MVSLFLLLGCNLSYIVDLFAALHELASASARTLLKLASSVHALLKPYWDTLRTFALIVSAHPYSTRKFTCHVMHRAHALSFKMNNEVKSDQKKNYCDDHSSLHIQPQYKYELFHIYFTKWTMIGQMAIAIALLGFNDLGRSGDPYFLFRNRFNLQLSPH